MVRKPLTAVYMFMRLTPFFLALAASASLSIAQAQEATGKPPVPAPPAHTHDEGAPHVHDEKVPENETLVEYFWRKSDDAFHDGDYPRAIGLHKAIVAIDPTEVESYSIGAWLLWSMDKSDEALAFLQRGLTANPADPDMWDAAGQHYDLQKRFNESEAAFAKAIQYSGKDVDQLLRRRYAHAAEHAGKYDKGIETWRALVADYPNEPVNKNNLARAEREMNAKGQKAQDTATAAAFSGAALMTGLAAARRKLLSD